MEPVRKKCKSKKLSELTELDKVLTKCKICYKDIMLGLLEHHFENKHKNKPLNLKVKCTELNCNKFFERNFAMRRHVREVHKKVKNRNLKCSKCTLKFSTRNDLVRHTRQKHPNLPYKCVYCKNTTRYQMSKLISHIKTRHFPKTVQEIATPERPDDPSNKGDFVNIIKKTNKGVIVEHGGLTMTLGRSNSSRIKEFSGEKDILIEDSSTFHPGPENVTYQSFIDRYCMNQCKGVAQINYVGHMVDGSFKPPNNPVENGINQNMIISKLADMTTEIDVGNDPDKPVYKTFYENFHPFFKSELFSTSIEQMHDKKFMDKQLIMSAQIISCYNRIDPIIDRNSLKKIAKGEGDLDFLLYRHLVLFVLVPGQNKIIILDPAGPADENHWFTIYLKERATKFANFFRVELKRENIEIISLGFQAENRQRACGIYVMNFLDAIIHQYKINLKQDKVGFEWISKKFAKSLQLSSTELSGYRQEITVRAVKRTNAKIILQPTVPKIKNPDCQTRYARFCTQTNCNEKFYNPRNFTEHNNYDLHRNKDGVYVCPIPTCGKTLGRKIRSHADTHFISIKSGPFKEFLCPSCFKEFNLEKYVIKHIAKNRVCPRCLVCFPRERPDHEILDCGKNMEHFCTLDVPKLSSEEIILLKSKIVFGEK